MLRLRPLLQVLLTFHLVLLAWLFFRLPSGAALGVWCQELFRLPVQAAVWGQSVLALLVLALGGGMALLRRWGVKPLLEGAGDKGGIPWAALLTWSLTLVLILFVGAERGNPFIYEQF